MLIEEILDELQVFSFFELASSVSGSWKKFQTGSNAYGCERIVEALALAWPDEAVSIAVHYQKGRIITTCVPDRIRFVGLVGTCLDCTSYQQRLGRKGRIMIQDTARKGKRVRGHF